MPSFKVLLAEGRVLRVFALGRVVSPVLVDMFALAGGYDGFWLDQEHAGLTYEQMVVASLAARANNFDCFVRMAPTGYSQVTQCLETGAGGVMAARIESAAQAEQFVQWAKFAPRGSRGMNTSGRDAHYTHKAPAQFAADANRDGLVAIQIETRGALDEAERIAAIDGVDVLFVGPVDLSQALGITGQLGHETLWAGIERVSAACRKYGKHWGIVPPDPTLAERAVELGCQILTMGNDVMCLRRGIQAVKESYARRFAVGTSS
jgi:2-dehydro-3-deoxyglucarate aldolase/4-hydroxy-2-oxoheptanedioate aldolase